jgi:hypothetical protein
MLYSRHPYINKRYSYLDGREKAGRKEIETTKSHEKVEENIDALNSKSGVDIPLPNQVEDKKIASRKLVLRKPGLPQKPSFFDAIRERIHIEELILIGLIILFLKDGIEDELITILLIYILLG